MKQFHIKLGTLDVATCTVLEFVGQERSSCDYQFDVTVACSADPAIVENELLEQPGWLSIYVQGSDFRRIHGVVTGVRWQGLSAGQHTFVVRLRPRFNLLTQRRNSRIFQAFSVPEIIDAVLEQHRVKHRWAIMRSYPKREYCVQYRETDHAFVTRLVQEEGMFSYFTHTNEATGSETLVFSDDVGICPSIDGDPGLEYRPSSGQDAMAMREEHVHEFSAERSVRPTAVTVREYDFERPQLELTSATSTGPLDGHNGDLRYEHYEHHSDYEKVDVGRDDATTRLEQLRRDAHLGAGETPCRRLLPGHRFTLMHHPLQTYNRGWVVTAVEHQGRRSTAAEHDLVYSSRFEAAPDHVQIRSAIAHRSVQQVVETATVVGPSGEEIHTDRFGRIKVRFHWDRDTLRHGFSSCWLRHVEGWAGPGYGTQRIPRVGMEVLVSFLSGDVDRPIVIGCVNNAKHMAPFQLPEEKAKSGIKTHSTPNGDGYNELSFDDANGRELVNLRAERDLRVGTGNDYSLTVGHNGLFSVSAMETRRSGARQTHIGTEDSTIVAGNQQVDVGGHSSFVVGGHRRVRVGALDHHSVSGDSQWIVDGTCMVRSGGSYTLSVGGRDARSACQISSEGSIALSAARTIRIATSERLVLACGETSIELDGKTITMRAPTIAVSGNTVAVRGNGPMLALGDEAELFAQKSTVTSPCGGLTFDEDTNIWGEQVRLSKARTSPPKQDAADAVKTKPFKLQLLDEHRMPFGAKRYVIIADGKRQEGNTDADGRIDTTIPESSFLADVTLWIDEYPTGRRRQWSVDVGELEGAETPRGAMHRLRNLGYHSGGVADQVAEEDTALKAAVAWFQKDQDLPSTGELDAATAAEIAAQHGN